jgi:hypothetical protein
VIPVFFHLGPLPVTSAAVLWKLRRERLRTPVFADAAAPALAGGYVVGRLGCFLVGDDYGRPTDLPWGLAFPHGAPPSTAGNLREMFGVALAPGIPDSAVLAAHPTQLYEAFFRAKDDHLPFGLTLAQGISLALVAGAVLLALVLREREPGTHVAIVGRGWTDS